MVSFKEFPLPVLKSLYVFSAIILTSYLVSWSGIELLFTPLLVSFLTHFHSDCPLHLKPQTVYSLLTLPVTPDKLSAALDEGK